MVRLKGHAAKQAVEVAEKRFGSRGKGASGEREVAKLLQAWWATVEPECLFAKTPLSGGWGSPKMRAGFKASGDLSTTAALFPFTVEVKRREAWAWKNFERGFKSPVWGWWSQAQVQAAEMGLEPMMWFRRNRGSWFVLMREAYKPAHLMVPVVEWMKPPKGLKAKEHHPVCYGGQSLLAQCPRLFARAAF